VSGAASAPPAAVEPRRRAERGRGNAPSLPPEPRGEVGSVIDGPGAAPGPSPRAAARRVRGGVGWVRIPRREYEGSSKRAPDLFFFITHNHVVILLEPGPRRLPFGFTKRRRSLSRTRAARGIYKHGASAGKKSVIFHVFFFFFLCFYFFFFFFFCTPTAPHHTRGQTRANAHPTQPRSSSPALWIAPPLRPSIGGSTGWG